MNDFKSIEQYTPNRILSQTEIRNILLNLSKLEGITDLTVEPGIIRIEYYPQLLSSDTVKYTLVEAGFPFTTDANRKRRFKKFIAGLANDNKKTFGNNRLECCDLNKE